MTLYIGKLPTIAQGAAFALEQGYQPRLMKGVGADTAKLLLETQTRKREAKLCAALKTAGFAFHHDAIGSTYEPSWNPGKTYTRKMCAVWLVVTL